MNFLFLTALKAEAQPIIDGFGLHKNPTTHLYQRKKIMLFITGVGKEKTKNRLNQLTPLLKDLGQIVIINIGIAGGNPKNTNIGNMYLIRSITDDESHELVFPDQLDNHSFNEIELTTVSKGVTDYGKQFDGLVDMEASVIYEMMSKKVSPYRMLFLKVVSDYMDTEDWASIDASGLVEKHLNSIKTQVIKAI
ncbi:MAG: hypothetical protein ISR82_04710 [Candidatus Marinimicrobia bacterium]|nr:hypothetical protein [Candidatus Neomarinimicrobiota bacterium]MBL7010502.1 hypothetical protein [Candidatus Neomarinimicrobiota bacterium]MBL7030877.1 hypothetical protein [Candidatus Neomarinimicrobiota bacterium]